MMKCRRIYFSGRKPFFVLCSNCRGSDIHLHTPIHSLQTPYILLIFTLIYYIHQYKPYIHLYTPIHPYIYLIYTFYTLQTPYIFCGSVSSLVKFSFLFFQSNYHTLPLPKTKDKKIKPEIKLNSNIYLFYQEEDWGEQKQQQPQFFDIFSPSPCAASFQAFSVNAFR